ncbi:MAG: hypothetical protein AAB875_02580, partial [Patescibacteria group bacterium]
MDETPTPTQEGEQIATTPVTTATPQPSPVATPQPDLSKEQIAQEQTPPPPAEPTRKKNPIIWIAITLFVLALLAA